MSEESCPLRISVFDFAWRIRNLDVQQKVEAFIIAEKARAGGEEDLWILTRSRSSKVFFLLANMQNYLFLSVS